MAQGYCSCGAKLAGDALFCHRCGKPVRELVTAEPEEDNESAVQSATTDQIDQTRVQTVPPPAAAPISLRNGDVVRVAILTAALAHVFSSVVMITGSFVLLPVVILGFGGLAVYLYSRRTGLLLDPLHGARVGWIMGLFWFLIATVLFTITLTLQAGSGGLRGFFQKSFEAIGAQGPEMEQAMKLLESPAAVFVTIVITLIFEFLILTLIASMGGAIAARWLYRKHS